jgi:hypothetical protein
MISVFITKKKFPTLQSEVGNFLNNFRKRAPGRNRTRNFFITSEAFYRLNYKCVYIFIFVSPERIELSFRG